MKHVYRRRSQDSAAMNCARTEEDREAEAVRIIQSQEQALTNDAQTLADGNDALDLIASCSTASCRSIPRLLRRVARRNG